jgi:DNA-binding LytR/AlgR family response regulator
MERKHPELKFSISYFLLQLLLTSIGALITVIIVPDGSWLIAGTRYAASDGGFLTHDLILFLIWILMSNVIYLMLRFHETWKLSEIKLEGERRLKTEGVSIKIGAKNVKVPLKDICGFYVEDGTTFLINSNFATFIIDISLDKMEEILPNRYFFRVNRKFILHRNSIVSFKRIADNKLLITTLSEKPLPTELSMSRLKAPAFKKWFEQDSAVL